MMILRSQLIKRTSLLTHSHHHHLRRWLFARLVKVELVSNHEVLRKRCSYRESEAFYGVHFWDRHSQIFDPVKQHVKRRYECFVLSRMVLFVVNIVFFFYFFYANILIFTQSGFFLKEIQHNYKL